MLPLLYPGENVPRQIVDDFEHAPIPELHKHVFRWTKRFVAESWQLAERDVQSLREAGLSDSDIVNWAQIACLQTWWVMSADGGGIPLEGDAVVGPVVGRRRAKSCIRVLSSRFFPTWSASFDHTLFVSLV